MSRVDSLSHVDGFQAISNGMDAGRAPNLIGRNQVAFARNVTFRGSHPATRPGWPKRTLTFPNADVGNAFKSGLFQGAGGFEPYGGGKKLIVSVSGRLYSIDVMDAYRVADITPATASSAVEPKVWMEQAEDFIIIQNGVQASVIFDNAVTRRVNPSSVPKEVPVGKAMVYANGRLWVTLPQGRSFSAGNIVYGEDGTSPYNGRDSILKFSENDFLNGGGEFGVPFTAGRIRAMRALANLDTSLGQGPVQVLCERGIFSVNAPFLRDQWQNLSYPIQTVSLLGNGAQSHEASLAVNGDIWFRSLDGVRSFQIARRDFGAWVNTPLSTEMTPVISADDQNLLEHASAALFDNRYLVTASPFRVKDHGICWRGLIALDFHNVSGLTLRTSPAYDGLWTGLNILQIVPVADRCFLFALNSNSEIELWEVSRDNPNDNINTRISCYIDTPSFGFEDGGWNRKELTTGDVWADSLSGTINWTMQFRPDQYPDYIPWHTWCTVAKDSTCLTDCSTVLTQRPQYRPRMRLPLPSDSCNAKVNMPFRNGYEFQCRLSWIGHARIKKLRLVTHDVQEDVLPFCEPCETADATGITSCSDALYDYHADA